ncbi:MAG: FtsX-like permease family protein, partial [Eubacterium sp.]
MNYENNNNQKIIGKLAKSSLKANKMRNVFILFTIVLSVTLLMVVTLFMSGVQESEKRSMKDVQHAVYANVTADQIKKLESDPRVDYMTLDKRGTPVEIDNYTLRPSYYDGQSTAIKTLTLTEGSLPEQENEVLVTKAYLQTIGKDPLPGTTLDITFLDGTAETFVVSGIIDGAANTKQFPLILSQTYADNGSQLKEVAYEALIRIKGAEQMGKEECLGVIHSIGENADIIRANMNPNDRFLDTLTIDINSFMTIVFIGLLILTASILVIYGVFYVSVISKIRQYGQLRTLGMTKKQIKKLVHREGILLFAIGAPIGVLLGCIIGYFLKPDGFSVTNTLLIALIVVLINLITIFLSIKKPAKIASAISPIEASRYNAYAGDQKKDTKNLSRKLTPLRLASMNASRNRKKTLITVLSLGIGGILFMTAATYITSFDVNLFSRQGDFANAEYIVSFSENAKNQSETDLAGLQENSPFTDTFKNQILSIPGVKEIRSAETTSVNFDYEKQDLINKNDSAGPFTQDAIPAIKEHLVTGTADYDELLKGDTLLISRIGVMNEIYGWQFEVGDTITLYFYNGTESVPHDFKVAGTLDNNYAHKGGWFMLPEEVFSRYFPLNPISSLI